MWIVRVKNNKKGKYVVLYDIKFLANIFSFFFVSGKDIFLQSGIVEDDTSRMLNP